MMDSADNLKGNPRRRASATVRGFHYQFWRTVEAWIDISPDELLFVEGAEDFDLVRTGEATAVQVKDDRASGPLTLSNAKALEALSNFWNLTRANRGRSVHFQFMTTAETGFEKDGFSGRKGIELWNGCARSSLDVCAGDIALFREFLVKRRSLDQRLRKFLKDASVADIWQQLVKPVEWLYDQPALDSIHELVVGRLLERGRQRGLTARDATQLGNDLHQVVVAAAIKQPPEPLTYISFVERFDRAVNVEIPREVLRRASYTDAIDQLVARGLEPGGSDLPALTEMADAFAAPVLAGKVWSRAVLIGRVRTALAAGSVFVDGSAGMGKTTLVRQAVDGKEPLLWAGLRDRTVREVVDTCRSLIRRIGTGPAAPTVVLDDLSPEGGPRALEEHLGRLNAAVRVRRGALVIVSYRQAGPRLASILGLPAASSVSVPSFDQEEIQQFVVAEGCPMPHAGELARIVWLQTSGHPLLVAGRIDALKAASFPKQTFTDVLDQPKEIRDARAEALHVVRSVLSDDARNLLYRLSLAIPVLKRSHALRIGGADPSIPRAGEMFDQLLGPWLEQPVPDRYRVSALVSRAGQEVLSPDEVKQVHGQIATALLAERKLSVSEFSGVIVHALSGSAEAHLAIAARVFLTASRDNKERLAKEVSWIAPVGVGPSTHLPIANKAVRQVFRLFQWEVAGLAAPRYIDPLAKVMEGDFSGDVDELVEILPRILYLSKLLLQIDYPISPDRIVAHTLELWRLSERANSQGITTLGGELPPMYPGLERPIFADMFAAVLIPRIRKVADLVTLISALDALDADSREFLLNGFKTDDGELRLLFNGPWVSMKRGDERGFEDYANALEASVSAGRRWQHSPWMRASTRSLSAILDEMLDRRADAERVLAATSQEVGSSPNLDDQVATIAFNRKEYAAALESWQRILPTWKADKLVYDMQPIFSTRCAAIASANLDKWDVAARLFGEAIERSADLGLRPWRVGLLGDRGYALWRSGDHKGSVAVFFGAVETLEVLPNRPESFAEYAVQKLVGHTLAWLAVPDGPNAMPIPGMCSNLEPSEGIKQLPPAPTVQAWFLLYEMARQAGDDAAAAACVDKFRDAPFSFLRAVAARDTLERHLKVGPFGDVLRLATTTALESDKSAQRKETPTQEPDPAGLTAHLSEASLEAFIRPALWSAIMRAEVLALSMTDLVANWREEIDPVQPYIADEVSMCERYFAMPVGELGPILRDTREANEKRMLAAVLLLGRDDSSVQDALYAQVTVLEASKDHELLRSVAGESVDALVRRDWLRFCQNPFMLRSPRLYVDSIRRACDSRSVGWPAAARIILAGLPTANVSVPDSIRGRMEELAARVT